VLSSDFQHHFSVLRDFECPLRLELDYEVVARETTRGQAIQLRILPLLISRLSSLSLKSNLEDTGAKWFYVRIVRGHVQGQYQGLPCRGRRYDLVQP
jgi:hypothetical protein